jgi:hypothetical protein
VLEHSHQFTRIPIQDKSSRIWGYKQGGPYQSGLQKVKQFHYPQVSKAPQW